MAGFQLLSGQVELAELAVDLPLLDCELLLHDFLVDVREVFFEMVFDHDQADDEVVPRMVLCLVFVNLLA